MLQGKVNMQGLGNGWGWGAYVEFPKNQYVKKKMKTEFGSPEPMMPAYAAAWDFGAQKAARRHPWSKRLASLAMQMNSRFN